VENGSEQQEIEIMICEFPIVGGNTTGTVRKHSVVDPAL
jgi:hypothetical protein